MSELEEIRKRIENLELNLFHYDLPSILEMDELDVDSRKLSSISNFRPFEEYEENVYKHKNLRAVGGGDLGFILYAIDSKYFYSRESFEKIARGFLSYYEGNPYAKVFDNKPVDISIEDSFNRFHVSLFCDRDYYRDHPEDIEKNLGYKIKEFDLSVDDLIDLYEKELVHNELLKIFELDECPHDTPIIFKNFKVLVEDGNNTYGIAERDGIYYTFYYATS